MNYFWLALAAVAEIAGCFAFWAWLHIVEHTRPVGSDLAGAALCLLGASIILFGPRLYPI